jgi:hypothetical protein
MSVPSRSGDQREIGIPVGTDDGFGAGHITGENEVSGYSRNLRDRTRKKVHLSDRLQGYGSARSSCCVNVAHLEQTIRCDRSNRDPKHRGVGIDWNKLYPIGRDTSVILVVCTLYFD